MSKSDLLMLLLIAVIVAIFGLSIVSSEVTKKRQCFETAQAINMASRRIDGVCEVKTSDGYWTNEETFIRETGIQYLHELNSK